MWTTLALVASLGLSPAQGTQLSLTNVRPTYGVLGAPRPDTNFVPGDVFFLAFDIEGVKTDDAGKVLYAMKMKVTEVKTKKVWYETLAAQENIIAYNSLGGSKLPAFANVDIGLNMPAGEYELTVTVTDRAAKAEKELKHAFKVLPPKFGIVRLTTSLDPDNKVPAPMTGVPGQFIHVNFVTVGFARNTKKQPNMSLEMRVLDEKGKPVLSKPSVGEVTELQESVKALPMQFGIALNRTGKFTVELKAIDLVNKKDTAVLTFPLTVISNTGK